MVSRPSFLDRSRPSLLALPSEVPAVPEIPNPTPEIKRENITRTTSPDTLRQNQSPVNNTEGPEVKNYILL